MHKYYEVVTEWVDDQKRRGGNYSRIFHSISDTLYWLEDTLFNEPDITRVTIRILLRNDKGVREC